MRRRGLLDQGNVFLWAFVCVFVICIVAFLMITMLLGRVMQAMAFLGSENEARKHIDGLILELHKVLKRQYQVTTNVHVQIGLKFFLGDHKALGIMLSHRMGMLREGGFFLLLCRWVLSLIDSHVKFFVHRLLSCLHHRPSHR